MAIKKKSYLLRNGLLLLIAIQVLLIAGCNKSGTTGSTTNPVYTGVKVRKGALQNHALINGKIEAAQTAHVVSKVSGKVEQVNVDLGTVVKKGQVLMNLDANDLASNVEVAQAAVDTAGVAFELSAKNYQRGQSLLASAALSQADFDNNFEGNYLKAEAALRSAQAGLQKAQIAYNDTFVKAPFDGVITACNINPGEIVLPQTAVISMINLDKVVVKGGVDENRINQLSPGQTVPVKIAAVSDQPFTGNIAGISPAADPQTKAYTIKIKVANPEHILKPGMFAEVRIDQPQGLAMLIPKSAVVSAGENKSVFVLEDGRIHKRTVELAASDEQDTIVVSGLKEGETVILSPPDGLQEKQAINVRVEGTAL